MVGVSMYWLSVYYVVDLFLKNTLSDGMSRENEKDNF